MAFFSTLRIAWRNLGRNRRRTLMALLAIGIAEFVLIVIGGIWSGYGVVLIDTVTGPLVGHVQVHAPKWREDRALDRYLPECARRLEAIRAVPGVTNVTARLYAPALVAVGEEGQAAMVVGLDTTAERQRGMLDGVELTQLPHGSNVLLGRIFAGALGAKVGDELALVGQAADGSVASGLYRVVSIIDTPLDLVNRRGVLMDLGEARELLALPNAAHELVIHGDDPQNAAHLATRLAGLPELEDSEVLPWQTIAPEFANLVQFMWAYELFLLLLVFIASAAGAANTMMMATYERVRELGMLLALGAKPRRLLSLVLAEGGFLGLVGLCLGTALGVAVVLYTGETGIDLSKIASEGGASLSWGGFRSTMLIHPVLSLSSLVRSSIAVLLTSLLAALWPAFRAARLEPVEAMRA